MTADFRSLLATLTSLERLDELIGDGAVESRVLEFRGILPKDRGGRTRFLRTASAFANTDGGVVVFGMQRAGDGAYRAGGLKDFDLDAAQRKLGQMLFNGVEPPPRVAEPRLLSGPERDPVLVYSVPRSFNRPHAVLEQEDRATFRSYWQRGDGYNFGMTTDELRDSFLEYDHWIAQASEFRAARVGTVYRGSRMPSVLQDHPHIFAHMVPLGRRRGLDFSVPLVPDIRSFFTIPALPGLQDRANTEGWLSLSPLGGVYSTWVQCFRNGAVEFVRGYPAEAAGPGLSATLLRGRGIEGRLVPFLTATMKWLRLTQAAPPYALSFAVTGAMGFALWAPDRNLDLPRGGFDRDVILLDEMVFDTLPEQPDNASVARLARPALDLLWQASGYTRSPYFDEANGNWLG